jgi:hypothetical protein
MHSLSNQSVILSILYWAALSDGELELNEVAIIKKAAAILYASAPTEAIDSLAANEGQQALAVQPSEAEIVRLMSSLNSSDEKQMVVKFVYKIIACSRREIDTCQINNEEKSVYRRLVAASELSQEKVDEAEWAARVELKNKPSVNEVISDLIEKVKHSFGAQQPSNSASSTGS